MQRQVRAASPDDRDASLDVCEAAFVTEPAFTYFFGDEYDVHARTFLGFLFDLRMGGGIARVEEVNGRIAAVSLWDSPAGSTLDEATQESMWRGLAELEGNGGRGHS